MSAVAPPVPREALEFFKQKKLKVGFDYRDVWNDEHDLNFTVAKVTELGVLESIRGSIEKAISDGQPFGQWRKNLRPELERKGWWGPREVLDKDTGEIAVTELGSPRRLRTIYENNMRVAYNAGQWERIQRTKSVLPYVLRTVGPSVEHRPEHLAWHGTLLPADDPWWLNHPCPGGWGCKCINRQIGRVERDRLVKEGVPTPGRQEINPRTGLPTGRLVRGRSPALTTAPADRMVSWTNRRTGKTELIPKGIDPGFAYRPGDASRKARLVGALTEKLNAADAPIAKTIIGEWVQGSGTLRSWLAKPEGAMPIAVVQDAQAVAVGAKTHVVQLSAETMAKQIARHPELVAEDYLAIPRVVDKGRSVQDTAKSMLFVLDDEPGYVAVVKSTASGAGLFLTSYRKLSRDAAKRDRTLRQLLGE